MTVVLDGFRLALAFTTIAACGEPLRPLSHVASSDPAHRQDQAMIHLVRDVARYIAASPRIVDDLARRLGAIERHGEGDGALLVRPADTRIQGVRIERYPDGTPFTVRLTFVRPITVVDLEAAFGAYETLPRSELDAPWSLEISSVAQGSAGSVSLLVEVDGPLAELDLRETRSVTLVIDPPDEP
jgi:hypothetical protein